MVAEQFNSTTNDTFNGKVILVTGGAGYLATTLVALLKDVTCRIIRVDLGESSREQVSGIARITDVAADVSDPSIWVSLLVGVDYIFHFAAQTSTYVANDDPVADLAINVLPMLHLLETCRRQQIRPVICFSSTVTVAGIPERLLVDETHADHPQTIYDLHKQMAEQYLRWYTEQGFVRGVTLRLANVYGPGPRSSRSDRGILNQMMRRALAGEDLTVYGTGEYIRDYIYVEDVARAFILAACNWEKLNGNVYVIGSGKGYTIADAMGIIADRCAAKTGGKAVVRHVTPPSTLSPIELRHFVADSRKFSEAVGWIPRYSFTEGIDRTMEELL